MRRYLLASLFSICTVFPHDLYLMPQSFVVKPGQQLRIVYQNGEGFPDAPAITKPERLRNTQLLSKAGTAKFEIVGRTDAKGRVRVPIKAIGAQKLHALVMERCVEPKVADWESFWASLTFEIQPKPGN